MNNHQWCVVILDKSRSEKECLGGYSHDCLSFVFVLMISKSFCWWYKYVCEVSRAYTQRKTWSERIYSPQCSLKHCLQQPRYGSDLNVHWQRDGWRRCGTYIQWNIRGPLKKETMPFAAPWKNLEIVMLSEVSWKENQSHSVTSSYMWNLKKKLDKWTYLQNRSRLTDLKNELTVVGGKFSNRESKEKWVCYFKYSTHCSI